MGQEGNIMVHTEKEKFSHTSTNLHTPWIKICNTGARVRGKKLRNSQASEKTSL